MKLIFDIALYIPILPLVLLLVRRQRWHLVKRNFTILLAAILLISLGAELVKIMGYKNTMPFFHAYLLIEFFLLTLIFSQMIGDSFFKLKWSLPFFIFLLVWLVNGFLGQGFNQFPNFPLGAQALLVLLYTIVWFGKMMREKKIKDPARNFEFWFCTSLFVFYSGNLLVFIFYLFIMNASIELLNPVWAIHAILIILLYLLYSFAILWIPRTTK